MMAEQGTEQWFMDRLGKLTASRMVDVLATTKSGQSASRKNYLAQLVAERMTGVRQESFSNAAILWGVEHEPLARAEYEMLRDVMVDQTGFIDHPTIAMCGASVDGLVGSDGLIEIKAPNTATHIDYLLAGVPPSKYQPQMALQLLCTGRAWCDFVSYDPRMPESHRLFVVRYVPTEEYLKTVAAEAVAFLEEVAEVVARLESITQQKEAA